MPFLSTFAVDNYYRVLENVFGYSFSIQSCMLSGKYPDENDHWMPYYYCPERSPVLFKTLNLIGKLTPLDRLKTFRYLMERGSRKLFLNSGVQINNIPLSIIDKITLYPYYYMSELPFFFELKEQLKKLSQTNLSYIGPPELKINLNVNLFEYLRNSKYEKEVIIIYYDTLDMLSHRYGPFSHQCLNYVKQLDSVIASTYQKLINSYDNLKFLVFSDHSQSELHFQINILSELRKKELRLDYDYICFIDATIALFWPKNVIVKEKIMYVLSKIKQGKVLNKIHKKKYHMEFTDNRFGKIIFSLKPGGTFFPNFYSSFKPMKGLHGYLPENDVQSAFLISNKELPYSFQHVKDIRKLLELFTNKTE
jgi:hypothetical protein